MAIEFASVAIVRAGSGSAVGLSHYIDRSNGRDRVNGTSYCFDGKDVDVLGRGLMVPETAPDWAFDTNALWNAATERELVRDRKTGELRFSRHGEPQVAKSYVLALPKELSAEDNHALLQSWLDHKFTQAGVAVQWAIHRDHGENGNVHAHVLVSTRRLGPDGFGAKARELNPQFARAPGLQKGFIAETGALTREWRAFQDEFFRARGLALTVDPSRMTPQLHLGAAFRTETSALHQANAARAERERENARRPERVLAHLTARAATFTARDLDTYLTKSSLPAQEVETARAAVLGHADLVRLEERQSGRDGQVLVIERFTTKVVLEQERGILADAGALTRQSAHPVRARAVQAARASRTLDSEQERALVYATQGQGLAVIRGRAGTGKSYTMAAIREAHESSGYRVIGLAPTNTVAADMRKDGFGEGRTVASEMLRQERGREAWDSRTVVIVDEMGMLSHRDMARVLSHARETGAKVIGLGDERQLASVERGGMFALVAEQARAVELTQVRRQRHEWQRQASAAAARGDLSATVRAYSERGAVRWSSDLGQARADLVRDWMEAVRAQSPTQPLPFVYAATNDAVDALNRDLRQARIALGQIDEEAGRTFATEKGERQLETVVSPGDRVTFHATVRDRAAKLELRNGESGVVTRIQDNRLTVHLDGGRAVTFDAVKHRGWGLGYAGTVYKGQGKTQGQVMTLYDHAHAWRREASYVALTRHAQDLKVYASQDLARDEVALGRQMERGGGKAAASSYTLAEPRRQEQTRERQAERARTPEGERQPVREWAQEHQLEPVTAEDRQRRMEGARMRVHGDRGRETTAEERLARMEEIRLRSGGAERALTAEERQARMAQVRQEQELGQQAAREGREHSATRDRMEERSQDRAQERSRDQGRGWER
jgi:Ti-type conjugative transfer relaxase TraA